jgi:hypothetical protein
MKKLIIIVQLLKIEVIISIKGSIRKKNLFNARIIVCVMLILPMARKNFVNIHLKMGGLHNVPIDLIKLNAIIKMNKK